MDSPGDEQQNLRREVIRRVTFGFRRPGGVFDGSDEKARCSADAGWDKSVNWCRTPWYKNLMLLV